MSEGPADATTGPIDRDVLDRIADYLRGTRRFGEIYAQPAEAPNSVVAEYDTGYFPSAIERSSLQIRWFKTDDFSIHYAEQYRDGTTWECRWDRHPNDHNAHEHFHPPPDATTPGDDADYPLDWRDVLTRVLDRLDERAEAFWEN
jgi:hypothetical protein